MAPPNTDSDQDGPETEDGGGSRDADSPLGGVETLILGCGAVGSAFASALQGAGAELSVWSRDSATAERLARRLGVRSLAGELPALAAFELVLIAVTDDALAGFCERLAATGARREPGSGFLFHTNGASGLEVLAPLAESGWALGKLHPVCAIPSDAIPSDAHASNALRGAWFATVVSGGAESWTARVIQAVGGHELPLTKDRDASLRLHAAAALLSGGLVALFDQAAEVARGASEDPGEDTDGDPDRVRRALLALLASTATNLAAQSPEDALTGPIARGSTGALERHLGVLDGEAREAYRLLGRRMLELAARRGVLSKDAQRALGELLD